MDANQAAETVKWLGETQGFWVQTGVLFFGLLIAARALSYNSKQVRLLREQTENSDRHARARATIDIVLHEKTNPVFLKARKKYGEMREKGVNMTAFACGKLTDHEEENDAIFMILNNYEFIACGLKNESLDEVLYKSMCRGTLIRDHDTLLPYIEELVRKNPEAKRAFCELKTLAQRWKSEVTATH